jgi:hypothetical protein
MAKSCPFPFLSSSGLPGALSNGFEEDGLDPVISLLDCGFASFKAIRSVTHLVLALMGGAMTASHLSNRKEQANGLSPSGSVFFGHFSFMPSTFRRQAAPLPRPIPIHRNPENVQCRALFIQFQKDSGS